MGKNLLLLCSGDRICALRLADVEETMRPLDCESLPDVPSYVRGVSIIRGRPTPVVDLRIMLGDSDAEDPRRLVTVRTGPDRHVALLVDDVLGFDDEQALGSRALPPLLQHANVNVTRLAELDHRLVNVLEAGRLVPSEVFDRVAEREEE